MSDQKTINRRDLLTQLAFAFAGAAVLGPSMNMCMRAEWIATETEMLEADGNTPEEATPDDIHDSMEEYYDTQYQPAVKKYITAIGAAMGLISHDQVINPVTEPDIY